jgi:hypothetical protein
VIPERLIELWEDLRWWVRRAVDRLGGGPDAPLTHEQRIRRRRAGALIVLVLGLYAVFRFVPVPGIPCSVSPAKTCIPADDAIANVPAGAEAYLHLNLDRDSSQFETALDTGSRLPHFQQIVQGVLARLGLASGLRLEEIGSWVGDEAALAYVGPRAQPLALLAVGDEKGADRFAAGLGENDPRTIGKGKEAIRAFRGGPAYVKQDGFLIIGTLPGVRGAVAAARTPKRSLEGSEAATEARDELPDLRVADLYLTPRGVERLLASRGGVAAQLDTFVDYSASRALAAALVAHDDGFELEADSLLRPRQAKRNPPFFAAFPRFDPGLAGEFAPSTVLFLNVANPAEAIQALLRQASATAPGLVQAFNRFEGQLTRGGVDLERGALPLLQGEAAAGASLTPVPHLTFVFGGVDEDQAREQMARLQGPLIQALSPERTGQAPAFDSEKVGDVVMRSVRLSPNLTLAYAVFDGKLVVATNPAGVRQAIEGDDNLSGEDAFEAASSSASSDVSALVFLSLEGLVRRAEPLGLEQIVRGFAEDIAALRGLGIGVKADDDSLETTAFLDIE